ncbi:MAG: efflux RND transporter permease subunit [Gammaproteobacteria bacterium]|nr:efflux RND transporter permease subunit [Gammaproteobacteria bacterium]MDP2140489.1 efflux RND transporter permease subunit [Gammaproteobacteria bacterium]MDP2348798.1 efflux RND transporter permease subunit [Gammaproteobacteria bacterium]
MRPVEQTSQKGIIAWFSSNSVAANLLMFFILFAGVASALTIKIQIFPDFETRMVQVTMAYPGAAPEEVEDAIVIRIEESLQGLAGINRMNAVAREGVGTISLEIAADYEVRDMLDEIQSRIDSISTFPADVERPTVREIEMTQPVLNVSIFGNLDDMALKTLAHNIRDEILALPQVSQATILGDRDYEIAIEVSENTLREYGLTLDQVAAAIRASSVDMPGGSIRTETGRIQLRTMEQAYTGADYGNIVLRTNRDGTRLLVRDIATVVDGFVETENFSRFDGNRSLSIQVVATRDQNVLDIERAVSAYIAERQPTLPSGVSVDSWGSTAFYLESQLNMMLGNLAMGALLVFLVLTTFLRLNMALWVMVGIPISFFGALWLMPVGPYPVDINMISLFGLILVLGIVVDDAIITAESVHSEVTQHGHSLDNVIKGTHRVAVPATFGVLTTIAAFAPMLLVGGQVAPFFEAIGMVVILCLIFSLIESKLILPAHLAHARLTEENKAPNRLTRFQDAVAKRLSHFIHFVYKPFLIKSLRNRYTTVSVFAGMMIVSVGLVAGNIVRFEFFPNVPSDFIQAQLVMNDGVSYEERNAALAQIERAVLSLNDDFPAEMPIDHVMVSTSGDSGGSIVVELTKAGDARNITAVEIEQAWREKTGFIANTEELRFFSSTNSGGGAKINLRLMGARYDELEQASLELEQKLRDYAGVFDVTNSYSRGSEEIVLRIKPDAQNLGLTASSLGSQVRQAFYGEEAQRILRGRDQLKVMVRYPKEERVSIANLEEMRIRTNDGLEVPFGQVADAEIGEGFARINRIDRQRTVTITSDVNALVAQSNTIIQDIRSNYIPELLAKYPSVTFGLGGASQEQAELLQRIAIFFGAAMFLIYALLAVPLKSYIQPAIVMAVIPFGMIGALIGHMIFGTTISMMSLFGLVALSGVIVNDSLIMVDFVNRGRREGMALHEAVVAAGTSRFRAILLTTLTTFLGLLPIMFETSMQAQLVIPMTLSLGWGILFGTVLTLVMIPSLYLILDDFTTFVMGKERAGASTAVLS